MKDGKLSPAQVSPLLDGGDGDLQQTALLVVSRRPEWAALAQGTMRKWLAGARLSADQEKSLSELLAGGSSDAAVQTVVAEALTAKETPPATRRFLIGVIGQTRTEPLPKSWVGALDIALADDTVVREALGVIKVRKWKQFDGHLQKLSREPRQPAEVRLAALECLAGRGALDAETFTFLVGHLSETSEPFLRLSAARTLGAAPLTAEQLIDLAERRASVNTMVLRLLLPVFSRTKDEKVGAALARSLERSKAAEALTVAELDQTLKDYPAPVREQAEPLRARLLGRQKGQAAYLAGLTSELDKLSGDADVGKEIFLSPKHSCFACHRAVGRGGELGPDLSKIGQFRTRAELLESIIFPSLTIAPEYRSHQIALTDGKSVTGLITRDAADALVLRMTDLAELRIPRKDIEDIAPAAVSLMPDGLERTLSRQELRDLLEFLVQQK
jgi:putative heme-binding domain-containing protein